jgi:Flp pilus assembly pilin Flp
MKLFLTQVWQEEEGVLTFEWVLLVTILTIGIVSGLTAARDAIIDEMGDVAQAMLALDQSFSIDFPLEVLIHDGNPSGSGSNSGFTDSADYVDCDRASGPDGQPDLP